LNLIRVMPAKGQDISVSISIRFVQSSSAQSSAQPAGSAAAASHVFEMGANQ
jgi:hypothetical protein